MRTDLEPKFKNTPEGKRADEILRTCVHCGFCNATCPTYQLTGDERDGPRGRIYLMKSALEGGPVTAMTREHLDRCLLCRTCETTCPSGVRYAELYEIGKAVVERKAPPGPLEGTQRWMMRKVFGDAHLSWAVFQSSRLLAPFLPTALKHRLPDTRKGRSRRRTATTRKVVGLQGCVQAATTPRIHEAAKALLAHLGIELVTAPGAGCCGAISQHLDAIPEARQQIRNNLRAWQPLLETAEAVVMTASGCGATVADYGRLLAGDANWSDAARRVSESTRDLGQLVVAEDLRTLADIGQGRRVAVHTPCTLRHALHADGNVEKILTACGFDVAPVVETLACCGAAGTYVLRHPRLSNQLLKAKLKDLQCHEPEVIVSANIGCMLHLQSDARIPVRHWVEVVAEAAGLID